MVFTFGVYGSFNIIGPHNLRGTGTNKEVWLCLSGYGLVGGSKSLWGQTLKFLVLRILPSGSVSFL